MMHLLHNAMRRQYQARLQRLHSKLKLAASAIEASYSGILMLDALGNIIQINAAFTRITGYTKADIHQRDFGVLLSDKCEPNLKHQLIESVRQQGEWHGEIWCKRFDGNEIPVKTSILAQASEDNTLVHMIATIEDVSVQKDAQTLIEFLVNRDRLTGLANRDALRSRFESSAQQALDTDNKIAMISMDLDRFKVINEALGHSVGDQLLRQLATRVSEALGDRFGFCRESGDEFHILTPLIADEAELDLLAKRLQHEINQAFFIDHKKLYISASMGAAIYPDHGTSFSDLQKKSGQALNASKRQGGNCFHLCTDEMDAEVRLRAQIESNLRSAIQNNEFHLVYQPKLSIHSGKIIGAEALVRWHSPRLGLISPANFIPLAEETGLILDIDEWVLNNVCAQLQHWNNRGLVVNKVSVNLSALQFQRGDLVERVRNSLCNYSIAPQQLDLEITEGMLMWNADHAISILDDLRAIGVSVSLDDFGTGFSSLSYLQKLPINTLKLDKSFVDHIHSNRQDANIVRTIVNLGKSLDLNIVAEGVEYEAQYDILKAAGCDEIQGYWFSKPLAVAEFEVLCARNSELALSR